MREVPFDTDGSSSSAHCKDLLDHGCIMEADFLDPSVLGRQDPSGWVLFRHNFERNIRIRMLKEQFFYDFCAYEGEREWGRGRYCYL